MTTLRFTRLFLLLSTLVALRAAPVIPDTGEPQSLLTYVDTEFALDASTTTTTTPGAYDSTSSVPTDSTNPVLLSPQDASEAESVSSPSQTTWALPSTFSDMSPFNVTSYAAGKPNMAVLAGSPGQWTNTTSMSSANATTAAAPNDTAQTELFAEYTDPWEFSPNSLEVLYPQGSINPGNQPQGGAEFYANPLDIAGAQNVSLQYSVYFPHDFDFVKGGKLPGLYGGHKGCSGGNAAEDCFSTRMMWRTDGLGELYLYVPKDKQSDSLCNTPPQSICESEYGLSIGRGAFTFARGDWTTIRQDVWLNTPGKNDGGFNIWANGQLVMSAGDVRYRENTTTCLESDADTANQSTIQAAQLPEGTSIQGADNSTGSWVEEDWMQAEAEPSSSSSPSPSSSLSSSSSASNTPSTILTTSGAIISTALTNIPTTSTSTSAPASFTHAIRTRSSAMSESTLTLTESSDMATSTPTTTTAVRRRNLGKFKHIRRQDVDVVPESSSIAGDTDEAAAASASTAITSSASDSSITSVASASDTTATSSTIVSPSSMSSPAPSSSSSSSPRPFIVSSSPQVASSNTNNKNSPISNDCSVGFIGLFFSTFFGGHTDDWASPKDQYTYFKDFKMWIN